MWASSWPLVLCSTCWNLVVAGVFPHHCGPHFSPSSMSHFTPISRSRAQLHQAAKSIHFTVSSVLSPTVLYVWWWVLFRKTFISSYLCISISFLSNLMILLSLLSIDFFKSFKFSGIQGKKLLLGWWYYGWAWFFLSSFFKKNFFGRTSQHVGSQFPDQGSNPHCLHWKRRVLTTGPPGKSLSSVSFMLLMTEDFSESSSVISPYSL